MRYIFFMGVQADEALVMQSSVLYNNNPTLHLVITLFHTALHKEIETFCLQVCDSFGDFLDFFIELDATIGYLYGGYLD
jgi:hypothetical protein